MLRLLSIYPWVNWQRRPRSYKGHRGRDRMVVALQLPV
jgi:hypothetical protein